MDFPLYAEKCLRIRIKAGDVVPFKLNAIQRRLHGLIEEQRARTGKVRVIVLKARQPGISTYVGGRFFWKTTFRKGVRAFILTHKDDATTNLFSMARRFYERAPWIARPTIKASNARELDFGDLDSGYRVGTAKAAGVGRSDTIQFFHGSEVAFWFNADEHASGALQAVPDMPGTEVILESTGNGMTGLFYSMCMEAERGEGDYILAFFPWFEHGEYETPCPKGWQAPAAMVRYQKTYGLSDDQTFWLYRKNRELAVAIAADPNEICWKFKQEYPATVEEAFQMADHDSLIASHVVAEARARSLPDDNLAPLVLGVDVARAGPDKTRLISRRGRKYGYELNETVNTPDLMQVVVRVAKAIQDLRPDHVFVDATGGYGASVVDRLNELGYDDKVTGVEFGGKAQEPEKYGNKRAEIGARLRDHLREPGGCDLVDDNELHRHFCAPGYKIDSSGRLVLESKEDIRKRTQFSPDGFDAAALTHSESVSKGNDRPVRVIRSVR